jgi:hypothetical protein
MQSEDTIYVATNSASHRGSSPYAGPAPRNLDCGRTTGTDRRAALASKRQVGRIAYVVPSPSTCSSRPAS